MSKYEIKLYSFEKPQQTCELPPWLDITHGCTSVSTCRQVTWGHGRFWTGQFWPQQGQQCRIL